MIEKECLAIKLGVEAYSVYLMGRKSSIQMDHRALQWLSNFLIVNSRTMRRSFSL